MQTHYSHLTHSLPYLDPCSEHQDECESGSAHRRRQATVGKRYKEVFSTSLNSSSIVDSKPIYLPTYLNSFPAPSTQYSHVSGPVESSQEWLRYPLCLTIYWRSIDFGVL